MAGSITVSSITLDSDNNFSIKSNTGATLFFANTSGVDIANSIGATAITNDKILSVANTKISGNIISSQITSVGGSQITANTIANSAFQTGAVENYMNAAGLGFGMRNRIINGAMVIDQRNAGASVTPTATAYGIDRWVLAISQASKLAMQQNAGSVTPPAGYINYLGLTSQSAYSITSTDYFILVQVIEGFNVADLAWGTASAATVTLSFWVRSSLTGTFGGSLENSAETRAYPFTYTISSANTWEQKTITIVGDTTGTWLTNNGAGIKINFGLGVGSTKSGTAGSWSANQYLSATGATSVVGTNGATFYITGVQLEKGSTATSFDYRPYGTELQLCQRYYETSADFGTNAQYDGQQIVVGVGATSFGGAVQFCQGKPFSVRKRTAPTVVLYYQDGSAGNVYRVDNAAKIAAVALYLNPAGFLYTYSASTAFNQGYGYYYSFTANAEL